VTRAIWGKRLYRFGQMIGVLSASSITLLTVADVILRYFFNKSIFGAAEITNALLGVLVGAGLIVVAGMRIHIHVDLFEHALRRLFPRGYRRWVFACELLGTLALAALLARHALHTIEFGELTAVLEFPIGWVYVLVAALVVVALAVLVSGWHVAPGHDEDRQ
jgi:TRAP-type C4-dicarboxylate transport system permease small subunit